MEPTGVQTADGTSDIVYELVAEAMIDPHTTQAGVEAGYADLLDFYVAGRCGVLGDVDAGVVVAAMGFFQPDRLRVVWERVLAVGPARLAARRYGAVLAERGAAALGEFPSGARLADLLERVTDAAHPCGKPLFAGWRAEPRPREPQARAAHAMHVLREWRGGVHVSAVSALGVPPLDAVVVNGGEAYATFYEWPQPWGDGRGSRDALARAEALTDAQCGAVFERALGGAERAELVELVAGAAAAAGTNAGSS